MTHRIRAAKATHAVGLGAAKATRAVTQGRAQLLGGVAEPPVLRSSISDLVLLSLMGDSRDSGAAKATHAVTQGRAQLLGPGTVLRRNMERHIS